MADGENIAIEFYEPGNAQDLAGCLIRLSTNLEKQQAMAEQNFSTALRMTMPTIVQKYLRHFELEQRVEALRYVTNPQASQLGSLESASIEADDSEYARMDAPFLDSTSCVPSAFRDPARSSSSTG